MAACATGDMPLGFLARELECTKEEWHSYVRCCLWQGALHERAH